MKKSNKKPNRKPSKRDWADVLDQNMGMGYKDPDANAGMRFVATKWDTSKGVNRNTKAMKAFNKVTAELDKEN